jgi:hypothetical protein
VFSSILRMRLQLRLVRPMRFYAVAAFAVLGHVHAVELVSNGSFEANGGANSTTLSNWTVVNHPLSSATKFFAQSGTKPAIARFDVAAPTLGAFAAMSDQPSPGASALFQDVAVPASGQTWVQMFLFVLNQHPEYFERNSLDPTVVPNQHVRVDVTTATADAFDVGAGVLLNVFKSTPDFPRETGYFPVAMNLTPFAGQTVRIRIAEVDNLHGLLVGVDDVRVTNVPPGSCAPVRPRLGAASCNLDIDGDGLLTATDGLLVLRRMLGFRGASVVTNVNFGSCATRNTDPTVNSALDVLFTSPGVMDLDGDANTLATTDGLLLLRGLQGLTNAAAINGAVAASGASRSTWASIQTAANLSCLTAFLP